MTSRIILREETLGLLSFYTRGKTTAREFQLSQL